MKNKAIIIGASTVGKTTLLKYLKETTNLAIDEADDYLVTMNGGKYPSDSEYKMNVLAPQMVKDILKRNNVIFFTNTAYFRPEDLEKAHEVGFHIIQLNIERDEMERRNRHRIEHEGYDDLSEYFSDMLAYQKEINEKGLVHKVIDTNQPTKKIAAELLQQLS